MSGVCACAGGVLAVRRWVFPKQKQIVDTLLPMLRAESEVRSYVGSHLVPGTPLLYKNTWISRRAKVKNIWRLHTVYMYMYMYVHVHVHVPC